MFSILNEIGNNSHFRTTAVVVASIGISAFLYVLVAITGYLSFGNAVGGNVVAMCKPPVLHPPGWIIDMFIRPTIGLLNYRQSCHCHPRHVLLSSPGPPMQSLGRRSTQMAAEEECRFGQQFSIQIRPSTATC